MNKGGLEADPRGLIYETYRMAGISAADCRSIFFDWALGMKDQINIKESLEALMVAYGRDNPDHPMTAVLLEGLNPPARAKRRGGRKRLD